jgi:hypothetical protein
VSVFLQFGYSLLAMFVSVGAVAAGDEFDLVNRRRAQAGLPELAHDAALARAAGLHARYLDRHRSAGNSGQGLSAHAQRRGVDEFSGEYPAARALAAGYPHREVLENVSMGYADAASAIESLMGAIYHRLTFLDLEADQLGVAVGEGSRVFLMGRGDVAGVCRSLPQEALARAPVDCLGRAVTRADYEALCADLPAQALFRPSHPVSCPNGVRLDAGYMGAVCSGVPQEARFDGHGRYYEPCENGVRVNAAWFDGVCAAPPAEAVYRPSGHFYEICKVPRRVHAEWFEAWCSAVPEEALYNDSGRYRRPCAGDSEIRVEYLQQLDAAKHAALPGVVVWPVDGARSVPPAFFIEEPDPLPDLAVSGYPVSIQFNPATGAEIEILTFVLFQDHAASLETVEPVLVMNRDNDPHGLMTEHEFALFPLERLDWGASYTVLVDARVDGVTHRYRWSFETRGADMPLLTAAGPDQRFIVQPGTDYLLYLPPDRDHPFTVLTARTRHHPGNEVSLELVDPNTLRVRITVRHCDQIRLRFDSGRSVWLIPTGCAGRPGARSTAGMMDETLSDGP